MRSVQYDQASLAPKRITVAAPPEVEVDFTMVVEERATGFCGLVVAADAHAVTLEDRHLARRSFPWSAAGFLLEGQPTTLRPPRRAAPSAPTRTASGSVAVPGARARVARASRILVEGVHDAALIERVWGDDLRLEGVVVVALDGVDNLAAELGELRPSAQRRIGVLVDHLVAGSKESRLVARITDPHVLVLGHPYVDIWEAVRPAALGIAAWPTVPRGESWKDGVCRALGENGGPLAMWRRVLAAVDSIADVEVPLRRSVEELIDFVTVMD